MRYKLCSIKTVQACNSLLPRVDIYRQPRATGLNSVLSVTFSQTLYGYCHNSVDYLWQRLLCQCPRPTFLQPSRRRKTWVRFDTPRGPEITVRVHPRKCCCLLSLMCIAMGRKLQLNPIPVVGLWVRWAQQVRAHPLLLLRTSAVTVTQEATLYEHGENLSGKWELRPFYPQSYCLLSRSLPRPVLRGPQ